MTKLLFLDTEFTGLDQARPDLISLALVDQTGREFYVELPESHWTVQCNEWVHFNVVSQLWRGEFVQTEAKIRKRLFHWIESIEDDAVIVSDCPDADFCQLMTLLPDWPKNLRKWPMPFNVRSMDDDLRPALQKIMGDYHVLAGSPHHALRDAHALRLCMLFALENGWRPEQFESDCFPLSLTLRPHSEQR